MIMDFLPAILATGGFAFVIWYMFNALTPTNINKVPNLQGKYKKTKAVAIGVGAVIVAALIALGIL